MTSEKIPFCLLSNKSTVFLLGRSAKTPLIYEKWAERNRNSEYPWVCFNLTEIPLFFCSSNGDHVLHIWRNPYHSRYCCCSIIAYFLVVALSYSDNCSTNEVLKCQRFCFLEQVLNSFQGGCLADLEVNRIEALLVCYCFSGVDSIIKISCVGWSWMCIVAAKGAKGKHQNLVISLLFLVPSPKFDKMIFYNIHLGFL